MMTLPFPILQKKTTLKTTKPHNSAREKRSLLFRAPSLITFSASSASGMPNPRLTIELDVSSNMCVNVAHLPTPI